MNYPKAEWLRSWLSRASSCLLDWWFTSCFVDSTWHYLERQRKWHGPGLPPPDRSTIVKSTLEAP